MFIKERSIDSNSNVFIIAELSANHNGSIDTAISTIKAAKRAGADCIKLQTYTADTITIDSINPDFIIKGTIWNGKSLYNLYKEAYTPWEWHEKLFKVAEEEDVGLIAISSSGKGRVTKFFIGSVAEKVIHSFKKDVLLVH